MTPTTKNHSAVGTWSAVSVCVKACLCTSTTLVPLYVHGFGGTVSPDTNLETTVVKHGP